MSAPFTKQTTTDQIFGSVLGDQSNSVVDGIFDSVRTSEPATSVVDEIFGSVTPASMADYGTDIVGHRDAGSGRSSAEKATVATAVLSAAEKSKGHRSTASFMLQMMASSDPALSAALLAGKTTDAPRTVSQMADEAMLAFLDAQAPHDE